MLSFKKLQEEDFLFLQRYLNKLSLETKNRFGPHGFDIESIRSILLESSVYKGYVAFYDKQEEFVAYTIVKIGYLDHDAPRLCGYGFSPDGFTDCTMAPSVADDWQGRGVGSGLFEFVLADLQNQGIKRAILWGGVQAQNLRAVYFYRKFGFRELGRFEYHGENIDMVLEI